MYQLNATIHDLDIFVQDTISLNTKQGDDLASTWVTKLVGACRGRHIPRKTRMPKVIVANDDNYALAAHSSILKSKAIVTINSIWDPSHLLI